MNSFFKNMAAFLFTTTLLVISSFVIAIPQANAVNSSDTAVNYSRMHITDRHMKAKICGDHYCTSSEFQQWQYGVVNSQRTSQGKVSAGQHGEDVMHGMAGMTPGATTMHGNPKTK